jgi:hypothetical protein
MKMMPKDRLKQMMDQQKKASGLTTTGDAVTPADGSKPATTTSATSASGNAGANYSQRKVRNFVTQKIRKCFFNSKIIVFELLRFKRGI